MSSRIGHNSENFGNAPARGIIRRVGRVRIRTNTDTTAQGACVRRDDVRRVQRRAQHAEGSVASQVHLLGWREAPVKVLVVPSELRQVTRIERAAPFLDDRVIAVQEGADHGECADV